MSHRMHGAQLFIKLDLWNASSHIWIKEDDKYKTAFRTNYGQFNH